MKNTKLSGKKNVVDCSDLTNEELDYLIGLYKAGVPEEQIESDKVFKKIKFEELED